MYVPTIPTQFTKIGPQHRLEIYVDYNLLSIIKNLEPLTNDVFTAQFVDCQFDEIVFLLLGNTKMPDEVRHILSLKTTTLSYFDPRTNRCKNKVQRIMQSEQITNQVIICI